MPFCSAETHVGLTVQPDTGLALYSSPRFTPSDDSAAGDRGLRRQAAACRVKPSARK